MRHILALATGLLALAACDSPPSPGMVGGAERTEVTIEGSRFSVYRQDDRVEVIRTSREWLPDWAEARAKAEMAIRQATGCAVRGGNSFDGGDQAMAKARLNCSGDLPPLERIGRGRLTARSWMTGCPKGAMCARPRSIANRSRRAGET